MTITKAQVEGWERIAFTHPTEDWYNFTLAQLAFEAGRKSSVSEPVAWISASGWVTASRPVMENSAEKGTVFTPLYK